MSGGTSGGASKSWYKRARPFLDAAVPFGQTLLGRAQEGQTDNPLRQQGEEVISDVLSGRFGDQSNERVDAQLRSAADYMAEQVGIGRNANNSAFQQGGGLWGTARMKGENEVRRQGLDDLNRYSTNLIAQNAAQQDQLRTGMVPTGIEQGDAEFNKMMRMLQAYGGMGSSGQSAWTI